MTNLQTQDTTNFEIHKIGTHFTAGQCVQQKEFTEYALLSGRMVVIITADMTAESGDICPFPSQYIIARRKSKHISPIQNIQIYIIKLRNVKAQFPRVLKIYPFQ